MRGPVRAQMAGISQAVCLLGCLNSSAFRADCEDVSSEALVSAPRGGPPGVIARARSQRDCGNVLSESSFEASWGLFLGALGVFFGPLGGLGPVGCLWGVLGASRGPIFPLLGISWGNLGALLGRFGRLLGRLQALLGRPGAVLGASCASFKRSWGPLGPSWSVGKPERRKRPNPQTRKRPIRGSRSRPDGGPGSIRGM